MTTPQAQPGPQSGTQATPQTGAALLVKNLEAQGVEFGPVDVAAFAEACGATGLKIQTPDQIAPTLKKALTISGPVVIGIPVDYSDNHHLMEIVHHSALN